MHHLIWTANGLLTFESIQLLHYISSLVGNSVNRQRDTWKLFGTTLPTHSYNHTQQLLDEYNFLQLCILFCSGPISMQIYNRQKVILKGQSYIYVDSVSVFISFFCEWKKFEVCCISLCEMFPNKILSLFGFILSVDSICRHITY